MGMAKSKGMINENGLWHVAICNQFSKPGVQMKVMLRSNKMKGLLVEPWLIFIFKHS